MCDELIGLKVTLSSRDAMLAEIQFMLDKVVPGCRFRGPKMPTPYGTLLKYGLLDLNYDATSDMAAARSHRGLSLLKEMRFVSQAAEHNSTAFDEDAFSFWTDLLNDFEENQIILKLFLEENSAGPSLERLQRFRQPSLMQFPISMEITDACLTNLESLWLLKHFYL
jgi:hypothetical protein